MPPVGLFLSYYAKKRPMHKHSFFTGQPIFSQLLSLIPKTMIQRLAREERVNHYCKSFTAYDHLVTMLYQGFFQCLSIRELITGLQANGPRLVHLGLKKTPRRSTLADANRRRSAVFFERLYHQLYQQLFNSIPDSRLKADRFFIIDSTTISLFTNVMQGAGTAKRDGRKKGGVKAHVLIDAAHNVPAFVRITEAKEHDLVFLQQLQVPPKSTVVFDRAYTNYQQFNKWTAAQITWVTRQKRDANYQLLENYVVSSALREAGILVDQKILLGRPSNKVKTPLVVARRIEYYDALENRTFTFLSNDFTLPAPQITDCYKRRWQIELLFKRIKQRYPLRYFLGQSPNAIKIQIWCILICDLLVEVVRKRVQRKSGKTWSSANLSAMIKHHLMTYTQLIQFLINPEKALLQYQTEQLKPPELF